MTVRLFRCLVIISVVLPFVGVLASMVSRAMLSEPLREYARAPSATMPPAWTLITCSILLAVWIVAIAGVYRLKRSARRLYALSLLMGVGLSPALGSYVDSGWGQLVFQVGFVLDGYLLAVMFGADLARHFNPAEGESGAPIGELAFPTLATKVAWFG